MNAAKSDSRSNGDAEVKARPFSNGTLHPKASAMRRHNVTGDGEAQAGTAGLAGTRGIDPVEPFKDSLLLHLRDSDTGVGNGDDDTAIRAHGRNLDFPTGGRILQCVIEEIL